MQLVANLKPDLAEETSLELLKGGRRLLNSGDHKESLAQLLEAFTLSPKNPAIQSALIDILACTSGYKLPSSITNALADAAIENNLNVQALATVLANQLENSTAVTSIIDYLNRTPPGQISSELPEQDIADILTDRLFMLVTTKATAISPITERLIGGLRRHFLGEWLADSSSQSYFLDHYPEALACVACQCFNTEYIFDLTSEEEARIARLQATIAEDIRAAHPIELAILGAYRPLWETLMGGAPDDLKYLISQAERWPGWIKLIWKIQFLAPCQEVFLKQKLVSLTPINADMSLEVGLQYEAFPYPRWQTTTIPEKPAFLADYIKHRFPNFDNSHLSPKPADILIAGCGTGEQVVQVGKGITTKNILAVDLSLNSLAHASRKAQELAMKNVHFNQADILGIGEWDATFDLIVCTGVLHHMQDPAAGLQALLQVSHDQTLFFLALYSERARGDVVAARNFISQKGLPDTVEGMRKFRTLVRELPNDHPAKPIERSREFYSASGLHDFVFNTHELRYTPLELKTLLEQNDMEFIGFDIKRGDHKTLYHNRFPDDIMMTNLENWDALEQDHPTVFDGMMQFWCHKKGT